MIDLYIAKILDACTPCTGEKRTEVAESINELYAMFDLSVPLIVWCDGPLQYTVLPSILHWAAHERSGIDKVSFLRNLFKPPAKKTSRSHLSVFFQLEKLPPIISSPVNATDLQLDAFLDKAELLFSTQIPRMGESLNARLMQRVQRSLSTRLCDHLQGSSNEKFRNDTDIILRRRLAPFFSRLRNISDALVLNHPLQRKLFRVENDMCPATEAGIDSKIVPRMILGQSWGAWDVFFLSTYDYARSIDLVQYSQSEDKELTLWMKLLAGGLAYLFVENVCFVFSYPEKLALDQGLQNHSETGPSIIFADGVKVFSWHGMVVPEIVIMEPAKLRPASIDDEPNIEIRRIMIERYGWEKYLRNSKAKLIHQDEFGKLYQKLVPGDEPIVAVEVVNSTAEPDGKFKRYMLRVPPNITTAKLAVAWTFGLSEGLYLPDVES